MLKLVSDGELMEIPLTDGIKAALILQGAAYYDDQEVFTLKPGVHEELREFLVKEIIAFNSAHRS